MSTPHITISFGLANIKLGPQEHVIGFQIEVSGGGFESISSLPKGWRIAIDNKSVSQTVMNADLSFGDEGLTTSLLDGIDVRLSQIEVEGTPFRVSGNMLVSNLGTERRILLGKTNFVPR